MLLFIIIKPCYFQVVDACCDFLKCHLHSSNCLGIEWFSHLHSLHKLESEARQYAIENFDSVIESDEFLQLSPERLCWYLARSDIDVSSEEKLYEAAIRWSERVQYPEGALCQVFCLIRFNFMSPVYLSEVVSKGKHFENCENCLSLVASQGSNGKSVLIGKYPEELKQDSLTSSPRPSTLAKEVIVILSSDDSENGVLETFDPVKDRWMVLTDERLPCTLVGVGITTIGNDIYVTGGIRREQVLAEVWCFLSKERRWKSLPSLLQPRAYHSCTSWNNCIYVFGGLSDYVVERRQAQAVEVVECLDLNSLLNTKKSEMISLSWKIVAKIPCPRIGSSAVAIEGRIIEVGGTQYGIPVKKLESYRWGHPWGTLINASSALFAGGEQLVLPDVIEKSQMVVVDGQLYILWMDSGKFILLNPTKRIFKDLARPCTSNVGGMAVVGSKIYVLGTWNNLDISSSKLIECYDTVKNIWVSTKYLGEWLNNVHCVTLKIK